MKLETYISDLLYRYDCVVVPDFGAFLTQSVSAKIHDSTHTFYPPKKVLSFNEQLKGNDGLLANYIADVEKIPYQIALEKLNKQVKAIKSFLTEGETIQFKHVGELYINSANKIEFNPSQDVNYLTQSFGLTHFNAQSVKRVQYKTEVETLEEKTETPVIVSSTSSPKQHWLKYAAAAVIVLGLGSYFSANYYINHIEEHNQLAQEKANEKLDHKIQEATFVINNPLPAATLNLSKQNGKFHVVGGAFRIKANSNKKVKQLQASGYKARVIGKNKYGLYEVVYGSYETRLNAQKALSKIRSAHNPDAWLLIKDLNN